MNLDKKKVNNEEILRTIVYTVGGGLGGYANNIQTTPTYTHFNSIFLGIIAANILGAIIEYKYKKVFKLRFVGAIALAGGLCSPGIINGVKVFVQLPFENYQLRNAVALEQHENLEANKTIILTSTDPKLKKEALQEIGEVVKRSDRPQDTIPTISEIAQAQDLETKEFAIEKLSTIVDSSEDINVVASGTEAIEATVDDSKDLKLIVNSLYKLRDLAIAAETEKKRKQIIDSIKDYQGKHEKTIDLMVKDILLELDRLIH